MHDEQLQHAFDETGLLCRQTDVLSQYTALLKDLLLSSVDSTAQGLSLQIIDVFLPELLDLLDVLESRIPDDAFQELLQPFLDCIVETQHPLLLNRIRYCPPLCHQPMPR